MGEVKLKFLKGSSKLIRFPDKKPVHSTRSKCYSDDGKSLKMDLKFFEAQHLEGFSSNLTL